MNKFQTPLDKLIKIYIHFQQNYIVIGESTNLKLIQCCRIYKKGKNMP